MGNGYLAVGHTVRLFANCDTFGAVFRFAGFVRALDFAFRFLAFHITNGVSWFLATGVASRRSFKLFMFLIFGTRRLGRRLQGISGHRISRRIKGDSGVPPIVLERKSIMLKQIGLLMTSLLKIIIIINFIYKFF